MSAPTPFATTAGAGIWRFSKGTQNWLLRHCFDRSICDKEMFAQLCPYLESVQGGAVLALCNRAQDIVDAADERSMEEQEERLKKKKAASKEGDVAVKAKLLHLKAKHKRARKVLRLLKDRVGADGDGDDDA